MSRPQEGRTRNGGSKPLTDTPRPDTRPGPRRSSARIDTDLRDRLIEAALTGLLASVGPTDLIDPDLAAEMSIQYADAVLMERAK